jgi:glycine/D-amino acid oxidase-like deaminating enzyme
MMRAPRPIPASTPLLTLPGAYIKPGGGDRVEIGTYRDEQVVYGHADEPADQEDNEVESIMCKLELLKTFIPDIEEYAPVHYTSAKTTYTPDGMPVLGRVGGGTGAGGVFAVSGCNGYGVTWSGGFGRIVAEAVLGGKNVPAELDAGRYEGWTEEEVKKGAAEKRRTKFGVWPPEEQGGVSANA